MLTLLFAIWLFGVSVKLGVFALKAGWGIMKFLLSVVFLPLTLLGLVIGGIIHLTVPVLVMIGLVTVAKYLLGGGRN